MKTSFILKGVAGIICITALTVASQDAEQPANPNPPASPAKTKDATKPLTPEAKESLMEKLKAAAANVSPQVVEIVKMSDAGADATVIQAYVENSTIAYTPRSEEIIYLHEHGIPSSVITAMIQRGAKLREQAATAQASAAAQAPPAS